MIVRPDGSSGLNRQELLLPWLSIAVTLLLGAALNQSDRAAPGARLRAATTAAAAWAMGMLPLLILFVYGAYAPSMLGKTIPVDTGTPAEPVRTREEAGVPAGTRVKLAEQDQEFVRRGMQPRGEHGNRVAERLAASQVLESSACDVALVPPRCIAPVRARLAMPGELAGSPVGWI